jgi:hypothetical protein
MTPQLRQRFFEATSHLDAVQILLGKTQNELPRGSALKLARLLRVHSSFISHVFRSKSVLSTEQLIAISAHFKLTDLETEYLLLLHSKDTTTTPNYLKFLDRKISEVKQATLGMSQRLGISNAQLPDLNLEFLSQWPYQLLLNLLCVSQLNSCSKLAKAMNLTEEALQIMLDTLEQQGLLKYSSPKFPQVSFSDIHLPKGSFAAQKTHLSWRIRMMEKALLGLRKEGDLRFTITAGCSPECYQEFVNALRNLMDEYRNRFAADKSEVVFSVVLDVDPFYSPKPIA